MEFHPPVLFRTYRDRISIRGSKAALSPCKLKKKRNLMVKFGSTYIKVVFKAKI